jgi:predicted TIM-barrel fold metal-dependent hydrolase
MRPRDYAGVPTIVNEQFLDPKDLIPIANKFKGIRFIIPNFGAGKFEETLTVGRSCPNVFVDTAGANSWIQSYPEPIDLRKVFQKTIEAYTSNRILFGSDSGMMPRGYRWDIVDNQLKLVQEMRLPIPDVKKIFYENASALFE